MRGHLGLHALQHTLSVSLRAKPAFPDNAKLHDAERPRNTVARSTLQAPQQHWVCRFQIARAHVWALLDYSARCPSRDRLRLWRAMRRGGFCLKMQAPAAHLGAPVAEPARSLCMLVLRCCRVRGLCKHLVIASGCSFKSQSAVLSTSPRCKCCVARSRKVWAGGFPGVQFEKPGCRSHPAIFSGRCKLAAGSAPLHVACALLPRTNPAGGAARSPHDVDASRTLRRLRRYSISPRTSALPLASSCRPARSLSVSTASLELAWLNCASSIWTRALRRWGPHGLRCGAPHGEFATRQGELQIRRQRVQRIAYALRRGHHEPHLRLLQPFARLAFTRHGRERRPVARSRRWRGARAIGTLQGGSAATVFTWASRRGRRRAPLQCAQRLFGPKVALCARNFYSGPAWIAVQDVALAQIASAAHVLRSWDF